MKKLLCSLVLVVAVAACTDSSTDVTSVSREASLAKPDTVYTYDGVTIEIYGPMNPRARERTSAIAATAGVRRAFSMLDERGIARATTSGIVVRAKDEKGRVLETTWLPGENPSNPGDMAGIAYFDLEGEARVVPFGARDEPEILFSNGKDAGPQRMFEFGGCYAFARDLYMACVSLCIQNGISDRACRGSCQAAGIAALTSCVLLSSVD